MDQEADASSVAQKMEHLNSNKTRRKTDLEQQNASHNSSHITPLTDNALHRIAQVH